MKAESAAIPPRDLASPRSHCGLHHRRRDRAQEWLSFFEFLSAHLRRESESGEGQSTVGERSKVVAALPVARLLSGTSVCICFLNSGRDRNHFVQFGDPEDIPDLWAQSGDNHLQALLLAANIMSRDDAQAGGIHIRTGGQV